MKWEHKIGIAITCTFLCLVGAVIGLKMRDQTIPQSPSMAATNAHEMEIPSPPERIPTLPDDPKKKSRHENEFAGSPPHRSAPPEPHAPSSPGSGRGRSPVSAASLAMNDPTLDPTDIVGKGSSAPEKNVDAEKKAKPQKPTKEKESSSPLLTNGRMSPGLFGSPKSDTQTKKPDLESVQPPLNKAGQPGQPSSDKSEVGKNKSAPAIAQKEPNRAGPEVLPSPKETKQFQGVQSPSAAPITQTVGNGGIVPFNSGALPPPSPPSPTKSGSGPSLISAPLSKSANDAPSASGPNIAPAFPEQPASPPKPPDPKTKETLPPPAPLPGKQPEMAKLAPIPAPPPSGFMPSAVSAPPAPPVLPPTPTSTSPPAPIVMPTNPSAALSPPSTPSPIAPSAPPPPPKPPADGSTFIPDRSSSAPGPVGVKPAPLPLPTPPSSPLATTPVNPAPPRPANNGPSVMVYDEQDYSCQPGDTWESLSKHFYTTVSYAKALQRHNQNHARASERMRDTGQLAPGERIFVPQSHILEVRYADAIPKPAAAPMPTTMPAGFVPNGSPPPVPPPARPNP